MPSSASSDVPSRTDVFFFFHFIQFGTDLGIFFALAILRTTTIL